MIFSHAIQMNILCNPTGKSGHFRAIDWLVEHNNLYTKVSNFCISKTKEMLIWSREYMPGNFQIITRDE